MRRLFALWVCSMWLHAEVIDVTEPPLFTEDSVHKYLGLATVGMAAITGIFHPEYEGETVEGYALHRNLAYTTAALAAATVTTGVWFHWDDIGLEYSVTDYDNTHAILAGTGAVLMIVAAVLGNDSMAHSTFGIAGTACMATAVVLEW